jgi:hypothetical protein
MHLPTKCAFRPDGEPPRPESLCAVVPSLAAWNTSPSTERNRPHGIGFCPCWHQAPAGSLHARRAARYLQPITCCRGVCGADRYSCTPRHLAEWARNNWGIQACRSHPQQSQCSLSSYCFLVWCSTETSFHIQPISNHGLHPDQWNEGFKTCVESRGKWCAPIFVPCQHTSAHRRHEPGKATNL